jgi:hypothetical protein
MNKLLKLALCSLILIACSKENKSSSNPRTGANSEYESNLEPESKGAYIAELHPLNSSVSGPLTGALNVVREGDDIIFDVRVSGGHPSAIVHAQNIRIGTECPTDKADINKDGFIDIIEGMPFYGDTLIPLDSDLNTQIGGANHFPVSDAFGGYIYNEIAKFERFIKDLRSQDIDPNDDIIKLKVNEPFNLIGHVVVIHGIPDNMNLPATVLSKNKLANYQTIPIACGVIRKMTETVGSMNQDARWQVPPG